MNVMNEVSSRQHHMNLEYNSASHMTGKTKNQVTPTASRYSSVGGAGHESQKTPNDDVIGTGTKRTVVLQNRRKSDRITVPFASVNTIERSLNNQVSDRVYKNPRLSKTDRQKARYKDLPETTKIQSQHPSMFQNNEPATMQKRQSALTSRRQRGRFVHCESSNIIAPDVAMNDAITFDQQKQQLPATQHPSMNLGVQMGIDGRFYASVMQEQMTELNNSYQGPTPGQESNIKSMQKLPSSSSKKMIKSLLSSRDSLELSERRQHLVQQQISSHKLRDKLGEYNEIYNSVQDSQKQQLNRSIRQPFPNFSLVQSPSPIEASATDQQPHNQSAKKKSVQYIREIDLLKDDPQTAAANLMKSTNEFCLTSRQTDAHESYQQFQPYQQPQHPQKQSYIQAKTNKAEKSKQLKHQVAQQIIATVQRNRVGQQQSSVQPLRQPIVSMIEGMEGIGNGGGPGDAIKSTQDLHGVGQIKHMNAYQKSAQPSSSQMYKQNNQLAIMNHGTLIQRHNSMEQLMQSSVRNSEGQQQDPQLSLRNMNEKRPSMPPHITVPMSISNNAEQQPQANRLTKRSSIQSSVKLLTSSRERPLQQSLYNNPVLVHSPGSLERLTFQKQQPFAAEESSEWIRKAIEASHVKLAESQYLTRLQSDDQQRTNKQAPRQLVQMGQPQMNIPALKGAGHHYQQPQLTQRQPYTDGIESPRPKPDLTESSVKRARLLLEKKKKQFERWPTQEQSKHNQTLTNMNLGDTGEGFTAGTTATESGGLLIGNGTNNATRMGFPTEVGKPILNVGGNLVCVPGITYKSMIPAQVAQAKQQSSNKNFLPPEHPLQNQQLFNGFQKNMMPTVASPVGGGPLRTNRKTKQDLALLANQGIQGKNISIISQNKMLQNQASVMRKFKREDNEQLVLDMKALETPQSQGIRSLAMLQQQLLGDSKDNRKNLRHAVNAADTGQILPNIPMLAADGDGSKVINNMLVFQHNGQTYIRQNERNYLAVTLNSIPNTDTETRKTNENQADELENNSALQKQPGQSHASVMADQMVQLGIGSRSLSKMLHGSQLESTLSQLAKHGYLSAVTPEDLETAGCIQQVTLLPSQQSPRMLKMRSRQEKLSKIKYTTSPPSKQVRPGESNGYQSTKPATSTTFNTSQRKGMDQDDAKNQFSSRRNRANMKEAKKLVKHQVHIFHEWADEEDSILRTHKINKAINTINSIIRLIFKNNKDSLAITTSNNPSMLGGPSGNRLIEDTRIEQMQKITKQIGIHIPKKFDSKQSVREFFHSREFILNVKIKMQNLLHSAILTANNMPQHIIELNMCGKDTISAAKDAANGKEESKIFAAKKFYVGPGNNFPIVKSVLKQRYWWQYGSEESFSADCDFIWTSWKKQKHIDYLTNVNNKYAQKMKKQKQQSPLPNPNKLLPNDLEPKLAASASETETKIQRKRKEKKPAVTPAVNIETEPAYSQEQIEKIVLPLRLYNKLEQNKQLTNKKGVFVNMRKYYESLAQDPFKVLPLTFHTQHGVNDAEFRKFTNYYNALEQKIKTQRAKMKREINEYQIEKGSKKALTKPADDEYGDEEEEDGDDEEAIQQIKKKYRTPNNTWIVKPGENSNRGVGITVVRSLKEVQGIVGNGTRMSKESDRTFIIQKYIDYPLLIHKRKFDFRCFGLLTSINGSLKGYCYQDGYIRTSCREYSLDDLADQTVHLTNDAIQQKDGDFGKFENGNKMSFQDFTKVITAQNPELDFDFQRDIFPQIQKLIADTYKASFFKIDPQRLQNCFELFGYDFMIDEDFRLYLIEVNTNPCLEVCSPLLARIIPELLDNCFKIVLDPLFPSPDLSHNRKFQLNELPQEVKFSLVFDEDIEGEQIRANFKRGIKGSIREAVGEEDIESDKEQELAEDDGENEAY